MRAQATIQKKVAAIGLGRLTKSLRCSLIILELIKHGWVSAVGWGWVGGWVELGAPPYAQVSHSVVDPPSPKNKLQKPNASCDLQIPCFEGRI